MESEWAGRETRFCALLHAIILTKLRHFQQEAEWLLAPQFTHLGVSSDAWNHLSGRWFRHIWRSDTGGLSSMPPDRPITLSGWNDRSRKVSQRWLVTGSIWWTARSRCFGFRDPLQSPVKDRCDPDHIQWVTWLSAKGEYTLRTSPSFPHVAV